MKKFLKHFFLTLGLVAVLILPYFVFAQTPIDELKTLSEETPYNNDTNETSMAVILGGVVYAFITLLGIIFIVLILIAGYNWMTSSGDETKVEKAKKTLTRAVIGLVIILSAGVIWAFIASRFGLII